MLALFGSSGASVSDNGQMGNGNWQLATSVLHWAKVARSVQQFSSGCTPKRPIRSGDKRAL